MAVVQFNLLPDVKLAYIRAQRQKQIVLFVSTIIIIASIALIVVMAMYMYVYQKTRISGLTENISDRNAELMETKDLSKVLTIQNQLNSLSSMHDTKQISSRVYDYLETVTPPEVTIAQLDVDYTQNTIVITGKGQTAAAINTYADALKFTKFTATERGSDDNAASDPSDPEPAFTNIVLGSLSYSGEGGNPDYSLSASFNPTLFTPLKLITLDVPDMITTRSVTERPGALFEKAGN